MAPRAPTRHLLDPVWYHHGMSEVWIIIHHDWVSVTAEVRAVYATEKLAYEHLVTKTPSGRRSTALDAHDERCCKIEDYVVQGS